MNRNADILTELKALESPLANLPWQLPYALPEGYFATLAEALTNGVHYTGLGDPVVTHLPKALPFDVPADYFSNLAEHLQNVAKQNPVLQSDVDTVYKVPDGYFESLPASLTAAAKQAVQVNKGKRRTILLLPVWKSRLVRIAAAAVLVLSIGFGSYRYFQAPTADRAVVSQLSKLDEGTIDTYLEQNVDEFDADALEATLASTQINLQSDISTLNASEIEDYLLESGEPATETQNTTL